MAVATVTDNGPPPGDSRLRVCYFGAYRANYSRNRIMIAGLRRQGVTVVECQAPLWRGVEDRVQAVNGGWRSPRFLWRVLTTYLQLVYKFWQIRGDFDVLVVGYPGQFDVYLAKLLALWTGAPLVWDVFMSIYLIAWERGLQRRNPVTTAMIRRLERGALRLPDMLVMDTAEYVRWFQAMHDVDPARCRLVPTGADSAVFRPVAAASGAPRRFRVIYYGSYIPNHGVLTIIEAAALLQDLDDVQFELIGDGPDRPLAEARAQALRLSNVTFVDWLDQASLVQRVGAADLCLGVFGATPQSLMTVQNKIYECLAMGKPVVTGVGPAVQAALHNGVEVYLCERSNPAALANAIQLFYSSPDIRGQIAAAGQRRFQEDYDIPQIGAAFARHLHDALATRRPSPLGRRA